mmetsp:Transcript_7092/g.32425  ORF Transcript_7092/g.32425 Transcript_7092/m.32425 type:complete len:250 (-) Transcript_7092:445-1194(-)
MKRLATSTSVGTTTFPGCTRSSASSSSSSSPNIRANEPANPPRRFASPAPPRRFASAAPRGTRQAPSPTLGRYRRSSSFAALSPSSESFASNTTSTDATATLGDRPLGGWLARCASASGCRLSTASAAALACSSWVGSRGVSPAAARSQPPPSSRPSADASPSPAVRPSVPMGAPGQRPKPSTRCRSFTTVLFFDVLDRPALDQPAPSPHGDASTTLPSYLATRYGLSAAIFGYPGMCLRFSGAYTTPG